MISFAVEEEETERVMKLLGDLGEETDFTAGSGKGSWYSSNPRFSEVGLSFVFSGGEFGSCSSLNSLNRLSFSDLKWRLGLVF